MEFLVFGDNAFTDGMLYVGTTIGKLHGISLKTGVKVWSFETETYRAARAKYFKPDDSYRDDIYSIIKSNEQFLEVEVELGGIFSRPVPPRTRSSSRARTGRFTVWRGKNGDPSLRSG